MIIDSSFFHTDLHIGQLDNLAVQEVVDTYIEIHEKKFLKILLGKELSKQYSQEYEGNLENLDEILVDREIRLSPIANYVYCQYLMRTHGIHQGIGVVIPNAENSMRINPVQKVVVAWNDMVRWICNDIHPEIRELGLDNYKYQHVKDICRSLCGCGSKPPFEIINRLGI